MIGQYLSNKNKSATVAKSEIFSELNKALQALKSHVPVVSVYELRTDMPDAQALLPLSLPLVRVQLPKSRSSLPTFLRFSFYASLEYIVVQ